MEGTILLHVRLGDLYVQVGFGIIHNLAVKLLLGTSFTDCFTREILPAECKVVPRHFHPVAIISATQRNQHVLTSISHVGASLVKQSDDKEASPH